MTNWEDVLAKCVAWSGQGPAPKVDPRVCNLCPQQETCDRVQCTRPDLQRGERASRITRPKEH